MSTIELARQKFSDAPEGDSVRRRRNEENSLVKKFLTGEFDVEVLRQNLSILENGKNRIEFPTPGHLHPLLKGLGFPEEYIKKRVREERAHFLATKEAGLKCKMVVEFSNETDAEERGVSEITIYPYLSIELPKGITSEKLRETIRKIIEAPINLQLELSVDDMAKLP